MKSPVYNVRKVPIDAIICNDYNPNSVAPPEMKLLELSIWEDGYTQPIVCYEDKEVNGYIIVDGFHRYRVIKESRRIREREDGFLPVVVIDKPISERMASTIRHNRARGVHAITAMSSLVYTLNGNGKSPTWIAKNLGMDADEVLRLLKNSAIVDVFKNYNFTNSQEE